MAAIRSLAEKLEGGSPVGPAGKGKTSAGEDLALWTPSLQPGEALSREPAWVPGLLSHRGARS